MVERSKAVSRGSASKRSSGTKTSAFGVSRRESHDSSGYYTRGLVRIEESTARGITPPSSVDEMFVHSATSMQEVADDSVALMITSPPYHVGKDYDSDSSFEEYMDLLEAVFAETYQKLQPGGRAVVNV